MKKLIIVLAIGGLITGCRQGENRAAMQTLPDRDENDSIQYPLLIDDGKRVVYQFGKMTADKGLKIYSDTMPYPAGGWKMDESLRQKLSAE